MSELTDRPECCGQPMQLRGGKSESGNIRFKCKYCGISTTGKHQEPILSDLRLLYLKNKVAAGSKKFVVTSACNNTSVDKKFLRSLLLYCKHNKAELVIIPIHYKNISLFTAGQEYKKKWSEDVAPYLVEEELDIGGNVTIRADIRLAATAHHPLSGNAPISGTKWIILGHPQFAMEPVACPMDNTPKRMYTTGCVTNNNYSKTKIGAKADFHHIKGALIIEVSDGASFIRQLNAGSVGSFYDLDKMYTPIKVIKNQRIAVLTTGDEHVKFHKKEVRSATYDNKDSIVNRLKPKYIVRHDVIDGYAGSHHHDKDDVLLFKKFHNKDNDYRAEFDEVVSFLNETTPPGVVNLIVQSNHHDHVYKWLFNVDPKTDPTNALFIHEMKGIQYKNVLEGKTTDPLEIYLSPRLTCRFKFLDRSEPWVYRGVNYNQHGDFGTKGTRGSASSFAKLTFKMVIGHSHSSRIVKGVYQVGTSAIRLEYEKGLGDNTNTHCIQYQNGKRTLIDIFNGRYHG